MARLCFEELSFERHDDKIRVVFLDTYFFEIEEGVLRDIADFEIEKNAIIFDTNEKRANSRFNMLLGRGFLNLTNRLTKRKAVYIHRGSGIPIIGSNSFGLVDRNTSLIEVKPVTGCNLSCIFCSVDEGKHGKWVTDYIVEAEYLVEGFRELAKNKNCRIEAHIGTHGEPLLYPRLAELIKGLAGIKNVGEISIDTNGTLLSKKLIDELKEAGLTRINLSLNAIDKAVAEKMAGTSFNVDHVIEVARYAKEKLGLLIAPIWVPGINDSEIPRLIEFGKELGVQVAIQNFLNYKYGRNPSKAVSWDVFFDKLRAYEKEYNMKLVFDEADFRIEKTHKLPKPFKKGDVVRAAVVCDGRLRGEKVAVAEKRSILVPDCPKNRGSIKVRIIRDKHNIFFAKYIG